MKSLKLAKLEKKLNKQSKKNKTSRKRKKKVNFPWLKRETSRRAKAYLCYLVDTSKQNTNFGKNAKKKKDFFAEHIYPAVCEKFPELYKEIKEYYESKGHDFDKPHFYEILYARLVNCYENGFKVKTYEHPENSLNLDYKYAYLDFFK